MTRFAVFYTLLIFLMLFSQAVADVTVSGTQTRGRGSDGKLRSTAVTLRNGGTVVRAADSGGGFWLESDTGQVMRFNDAGQAVGVSIPPGTWRAYPNLYRGHDEASVSVVISTGGGGGSNSAPRDEVNETRWTVNGHPVPWVFHGNGTVDAAGLWNGTWTLVQDGYQVNIGGGADRFVVRFSADRQSFQAFKSGQLYRQGVRQGASGR